MDNVRVFQVERGSRSSIPGSWSLANGTLRSRTCLSRSSPLADSPNGSGRPHAAWPVRCLHTRTPLLHSPAARRGLGRALSRGIVEGAILIGGGSATPKQRSNSVVSPVQPKRVFLAGAAVDSAARAHPPGRPAVRVVLATAGLIVFFLFNAILRLALNWDRCRLG